MTDHPAANAALEAGLAAVKHENYAAAIPLLEGFIAPLLGTNDDAPAVIKARMGLVVAYDRTQQLAAALGHCQRLTTSANVKVKAWANRTLTDLQARSRLAAAQSISPTADFGALDATGFVPLASGVSPSARPQFGPLGRSAWSSDAAITPAVPPDRSGAAADPAIASAEPNSAVEALHAAVTTPPRPPAGRAQKWSAIAKLAPLPLIAAQVGTVIALFCGFSLLALLNLALPSLWFRIKINLLGWSSYPPDTDLPLVLFGVILVGLWLASAPILDAVLRQFYRMQPLSTATLAQHSPETHRLLQRFCQQRRLPLLPLGVLPTPAPLAFTYGALPHLARIVVSQGLLEQLADDEIAAIYAIELGHIHHGDFSVMALVAVVTQLPYLLYRLAAQGGDWLRARSQQRESAYLALTLGIAADLAAIAAALSYGIYGLLRPTGLWLSKQRVAYSDRFACNLTGNPNGLTRALLKMATGTAQAIQHQQQTDPALESFDLLSALNQRTALALGSLANSTPWPQVLLWDQVNRQRHWLALNQSHPLLGERLQMLDRYTQKWQIASELELEATAPSGWQIPQPQALPFVGLGLGGLIASGFWGIGWGSYLAGNDQLRWMASDYKLFFGLPLIGFGVGTILRFNRFFPDLEALTAQQKRERIDSQPHRPSAAPVGPAAAIATQLTQPQLLVSQPIVLTGVLLGRPGLGNCLGQDLLLQTATGLIKLHYCSQVGVVGNLLRYHRLGDFIGQPVVAIGWLHRGAAPWLDVDSLQSQNGRTIGSGHQIWAVVLATATTLLGIVLIL